MEVENILFIDGIRKRNETLYWLAGFNKTLPLGTARWLRIARQDSKQRVANELYKALSLRLPFRIRNIIAVF